MRKLLKLIGLVQAARYGLGAQGRYGKPWKKGKKRYHAAAYGPQGYPPYGRRGSGGLKGMVLEAILRRLFRR